ncbi:hypothetical protein [Nonomuraea dietziae]|uniref:hypothetical protein n=1 Tax=Nonomuraea dietziae TaxID=65515 RepID=UPI0031E0475F
MEDRNTLTARSAVLSALLGSHPPRLPSRALVRVGEVFGIAEGTVRVALSRMVAAGDLVQDDGRYELSERPARAAGRHHGTRAASAHWCPHSDDDTPPQTAPQEHLLGRRQEGGCVAALLRTATEAVHV